MELISYTGYQVGGNHANCCLVAVCHEGVFEAFTYNAVAGGGSVGFPHVIEFIPVVPNLRDQLRMVMNVKRDEVLRNIYEVIAPGLPVGSYIVGTTHWTENDLKPQKNTYALRQAGMQVTTAPACRRYYGAYEQLSSERFDIVDFVGGCAAVQLGEFTRAILEEFKDYTFIMKHDEIYYEPMSLEETILGGAKRGELLWEMLYGRARFGEKHVVVGYFKDVTLTNVEKQNQKPLGVLDVKLDVFWEGEKLDPQRLLVAFKRLLVDEPNALSPWGLHEAVVLETDQFSETAFSIAADSIIPTSGYSVMANAHRWCTLNTTRPITAADVLSKEAIMGYMRGQALAIAHAIPGGYDICELVVLKEPDYLTIKHNLHQETKTYIRAV